MKDPHLIQYEIPKQPKLAPVVFDSYNKAVPQQQAMGSQRLKMLLEQGYIQSLNWPDAGWRLTPRGLEFADTSGVFPAGSIVFADIQDIATARLLGRSTAGSGVIEQLTVGTGLLLAAGVLSSTVTAYTDEQAEDAVGGILTDTPTIDFTYDDAGNKITADVIKQQSITSDASGLKLSGDAAAPGNAQFYGTNGSGTKGYNPLNQFALSLLASVAAVDMNTATPTTLYTVPAGKTAIITHVIVRNASASLTTASWSYGFTSAAFNDVIANATHTEITGNTLFTMLVPKVGALIGAAAGTFKVLMNTLQGGAATTAMDVYGYLF